MPPEPAAARWGLEEVAAAKRAESAERERAAPLADLQERIASQRPARGFAAALERERAAGRLGVIAESKRRSPSRGLLAQDYDPAARARLYESAGAACMSVLTDSPRFGGSADDLLAARQAGSMPVLRKDFICTPYQVHETRAMGADCMLLIAGLVSDAELAELAQLGMQLGLDVLVEVHVQQHLAAAVACGTGLIGINNRDLRTLRTDLAATDLLAPQLAQEDALIVSESAIAAAADAARAAAAGANAVLVGEALMRAPDPAALLAGLADAGSGKAAQNAPALK